MKDLKQIEEMEYAFFKGGEGALESDMMLNKLTRAKIRAFKSKFGRAFLGQINRYCEDAKKPYALKEYTGGMVYNFELAFVVPAQDEKLIQLITEREAAPYTGTTDDSRRINEIHARIYEIGGQYLFWS